jgi:hypothetical protein
MICSPLLWIAYIRYMHLELTDEQTEALIIKWATSNRNPVRGVAISWFSGPVTSLLRLAGFRMRHLAAHLGGRLVLAEPL